MGVVISPEQLLSADPSSLHFSPAPACDLPQRLQPFRVICSSLGSSQDAVLQEIPTSSTMIINGLWRNPGSGTNLEHFLPSLTEFGAHRSVSLTSHCHAPFCPFLTLFSWRHNHHALWWVGWSPLKSTVSGTAQPQPLLMEATSST